MHTAVLAVEGGPSPLLPHTSELIVGIVAFVLLYVFLSRKVFPIFERVYAERREAIQGGMEKAEADRAEAAALLARYREQMAEARHEASRIRADAQSERKGIVEHARTEAQQEAQRVVERTQGQLQAEVGQARAQLSREVGSLAVSLAERIVGENLADSERTRASVDRFIAELESAGTSTGPDGRGDAAPAGTERTTTGTTAGAGATRPDGQS